ncbi:hypothetical protein H6F74_11830 [Trichocoleus sp. FACHB-90]|uniref:hypothetical protein n=1 Tax=Cyanophyceae TaxID=3028117 RepID=UPI001682023B|nr:hypothetical protein [Trichocoleus sp. FACHB-90]MBD1926933.1 hypothetical protein [Trichocoleus sp. FACHB-90]
MRFQQQAITYTSQPGTTTLPIDPTLLLQYGNIPTAIILAIAILLWVLRPLMLKNSGFSKKRK